jgi:pyridoxal/pyridoxine/pyridoxamine kinase
MCDVLTPNQFEAGLLTGLPVTTEQEALVAAEALHATGPRTVVRGAGEEGDTVVLGVMAASMCNVSARTSGPAVHHTVQQLRCDLGCQQGGR